MSFSASTCITNLGSLAPTNPLLFYSDKDGYLDSFGSTTINQITSPNCPFIVTNIPDDTKIVKILGSNNVCVFLPLRNNDLCNECEFSISQGASVSQLRVISFNDTTTSCNTTEWILDYFGPNDDTIFAFSIGRGFSSGEYEYLMPNTGSFNIILPEGTYYPKIRKVKSNNFVYSRDGSSNTILAKLDCLDNVGVTIPRLFCNNGNSPGSTYNHRISFVANTNKQPPKEFFDLYISNQTKYLAIDFVPERNPDTLVVIFSGQNYPAPIFLENLTAGSNLNNVDFVNLPRLMIASNVRKVLSLTGFTISNNDFIRFEIQPNLTNFDTNYSIGIRCFDRDFDCNQCITTEYRNRTRKILRNSFRFTDADCGGGIVGWEYEPICNSFSPDLRNYLSFFSNPSQNSRSVFLGREERIQCFVSPQTNPDYTCTANTSSGNRITYKRIINQRKIIYQFENINTYNLYLTRIQEAINSYNGLTPSDINYYGYFTIAHYYNRFGVENVVCGGDNISSIENYFHGPTMNLTTSVTANNLYQIEIVQPPVDEAPFTLPAAACQSSCFLILGWNNMVDGQFSFLLSNIEYTSTVGLRMRQFYGSRQRFTSSGSSVVTQTALTINDSYTVNTNRFLLETYPYTADTTQPNGVRFLPTQQVCTSIIDGISTGNLSTSIIRIELDSVDNYRNFKIFCRPINNFVFGPLEYCYGFSGGQEYYFNPTYFI